MSEIPRYNIVKKRKTRGKQEVSNLLRPDQKKTIEKHVSQRKSNVGLRTATHVFHDHNPLCSSVKIDDSKEY